MNRVPRAFTAQYPGLVNVLISKVIIYNNLDKSKSITVDAIWDTGATNSCVSNKVANVLGLMPLGFVQTNTAAGTMNSKRYAVDIALPNSVGVRDVPVTNALLSEYDALISMDI